MRAAFLLRALTVCLLVGSLPGLPATAQEKPSERPSVKPADKLDKVSFGTNWVAEAEHGGFFQALADGTYARYGLDVTIVPGGPQTNNRLLLAAGKIEFNLAANLI